MADSTNCYLNHNNFSADFVYDSTNSACSNSIAQTGLSVSPKSESVKSKQQRTVNLSADICAIQSRVLAQPKTEQELLLQNNFNGSIDQLMINPDNFQNVHQRHRRSQSGDGTFLTCSNVVERVPQIINSAYFSPQDSQRWSAMHSRLDQSQLHNHANIHHRSSVPNFQVPSSNLTRHSISIDGVTFPLSYQQAYSENTQPFIGNESFSERHPYTRVRYSKGCLAEPYNVGFFRPNTSGSYSNEPSRQLYQHHNHPQRSRVNSDDLCHQYSNRDSYLYQQEASLCSLQHAIDNALEEKKQLQEDVRNLEIQVNSLLAVQRNPTESEYKNLREENDKLRNQLLIMISDLDNLGVSIPSFNLDEPHLPTSSPSKFLHQNNHQKKSPSNLPEKFIPSNRRNNETHKNQLPTLSSKPPLHYIVNNQLPLYENIDPNSNVSKTFNTSPPIPPRVPNESVEFLGENWKCPQCTFENLAILKCEMCDCNRPPTK